MKEQIESSLHGFGGFPTARHDHAGRLKLIVLKLSAQSRARRIVDSEDDVGVLQSSFYIGQPRGGARRDDGFGGQAVAGNANMDPAAVWHPHLDSTGISEYLQRQRCHFNDGDVMVARTWW